MPSSRREFLYGLGAFGSFALFNLEHMEPDLILYNANIWTVNPALPRAQAVAISKGRILAVGANEEVLGLAAGSAKKIDLAGKFVTAGFIDAHSHPAQAGLDHLRMVDCDLRSIAEIQAAASMSNAQAKVDAENFRSYVDSLEKDIDRKLGIHMEAVKHIVESAARGQEHAHEIDMAGLQHEQALTQASHTAALAPEPSQNVDSGSASRAE